MYLGCAEAEWWPAAMLVALVTAHCGRLRDDFRSGRGTSVEQMCLVPFAEHVSAVGIFVRHRPDHAAGQLRVYDVVDDGRHFSPSWIDQSRVPMRTLAVGRNHDDVKL